MGKTKAPKETQQTAAKDGPSAPQAQARPNGAQQARLFDIANGDNPGAASGANAVINQTINVGNGTDLAAITQAIKRGTAQALEFANVAYKAGQKRNKYVG